MRSVVGVSGGALQGSRLLVDGLGDVLDGLDLLFFKQGLAALLADPGRNVVDGDVAGAAIDMDRSRSPLHSSLAVKAFHGFFLTRYPSLHSSRLGR